MTSMTATQTLTMVEMTEDDVERAEEIAYALGWTQTAYTSTSALWGLFCLRDNAEHAEACIVKTQELGFLVIQDGENLNLGLDFSDVKHGF